MVLDKQRLFELDFLRFLAIYFVINVHCLDTLDETYLHEGLGSIGGIITNILYYLKNSGVPFFIMLSGILLLGKELSVKDFLLKRFSRILIPFFLWSVIVYLFSSFKHHNPTETLSVSDFIYLFCTDGVIGIYWFVYMILGLYLITPILQRAFKKGKDSDELILKYTSFLLLAIYVTCEILPKIEILSRFKSEQLVCLLLFVWGYYIYKYLLHKKNFKKISFILFGIATIALALNIHFHYCSNLIFEKLWPSFLFAVLLNFDLNCINDRSKTSIGFISRASYGFFLCHFLIISGLMRIIITPPIWTYPIIYPFMTIIICSGFFYLIDKSGAKRFLM